MRAAAWCLVSSCCLLFSIGEAGPWVSHVNVAGITAFASCTLVSQRSGVGQTGPKNAISRQTIMVSFKWQSGSPDGSADNWERGRPACIAPKARFIPAWAIGPGYSDKRRTGAESPYRRADLNTFLIVTTRAAHSPPVSAPTPHLPAPPPSVSTGKTQSKTPGHTTRIPVFRMEPRVGSC